MESFTNLEIAIMHALLKDNEYRLNQLMIHYPNDYQSVFTGLVNKGFIYEMKCRPEGRVNFKDLTVKGYTLFNGTFSRNKQ